MNEDAEIQAMSSVVSALNGLEDDATRARVLRWAAERYGISVPMPNSSASGNGAATDDDGRIRTKAPAVPTDPVFDDFVDLFDAVDPKTEMDKVLTGAYWLQAVNAQPSWQSMKINNLLKDTGHGVANITQSLTKAQRRSPALVRQVAKGKAAQSWKTYKLTTSGIAYVRDRLGITGAVPVVLTDDEAES
ncbi:hypothetical protein [Streptomyces cupreus]|uniref:Uncharacterized protein n=1 Tax=Streptomyces cupreus TaxID=2759956 RepID=A0A7X1J748_9ACTN|nr:hypothetical protein [Streptomyces cupreus]MBC2905369.1 hypothetical protein [Streptomyces cupreus]